MNWRPVCHRAAAIAGLFVLVVILGAVIQASYWIVPPGYETASILVAAALTPIAILLIALLVRGTGRRYREQAQRDVSAAVVCLLESIPEPALLVDELNQVRAASKAIEALLGYTIGEVTGRSLHDLLQEPESLRSWLMKAAGKFSADATHQNRQNAVGTRKDGTSIPLEVQCRDFVDGQRPQRILFLRDAARRSQMETALQEKDTQLRMLVEQMPAILWTTDRRLRITSTLGGGLSHLGMKAEEIVGLTMLEHLGKDSLDCTPIAAYVGAIRGESVNYEMDWKDRIFQVRVEPLRDSQKNIAGTIGIVLDITETKERIEELKARARQQATIAELGRAALAGRDLVPLFDRATRLVCTTLQIDYCVLSEVDAKRCSQKMLASASREDRVFSPPQSSTAQARERQAVVTGEPVVAEDLATSAATSFEAGAAVSFTSMASVPILGKKATTGVLSVFAVRKRKFSGDDVNFLQAVANVLASAMERRRVEEARMRLVAILEATTDFVAIADMNRRLTFINRAGREILGVGPEDEIGHLSLVDLYPTRESRRLLEQGLTCAVEKGAWSDEVILTTRRESEIPVSQVILAHKTSTGAVEFYSVLARDMTAQRRLEQEFRHAQKMEAVGRLAGGIAHDFNNLLTVIVGYADVLLNGLGEGGPLCGAAAEIKQAGERAAGLTRQLLAFSRRQMLAPKELHINDLLFELRPLIHRLLGEDIEVVTSLEPNLRAIRADKSQIEQVVMNLVVNARDAMPKGGRLTIESRNVIVDEEGSAGVSDLSPGSYIALAVTDTGCGMSDEVKAHVFEPFFTTKELGKGTGLGLATVYGIVQQSNGAIQFTSEPGKGTSIRVFVPSFEPTDAHVRALPHVPPPEPGTETVLLVEDEDAVRGLARLALGETGYQVLEARDGEEALTIAAAFAGPIDLLVSDVVMPKMSGTTLAERLTAQRRDMKVLFVSGFTDSVLLRHGALAGQIECLQKPYTSKSLLEKVREVLGQPELG
jgi:two-component system cell cycle sensor histidine kinase/response regulator CckA